MSWFDTFHMNDAILVSTGEPNPEGNGFSVTGRYRMGPTQDYWTWRTEYELANSDELRITAYNVTPQGEEAVNIGPPGGLSIGGLDLISFRTATIVHDDRDPVVPEPTSSVIVAMGAVSLLGFRRRR